MGVDHTTVLDKDGSDGGRESVRISSKKTFTHGLFLADIKHMPGNECGIWPAYWMFGPNWPNSGEIDIIEGVSLQEINVFTLHTGDTCTISGAQSLGTLQSSDCNQNHGFGCSITSSLSTSYGDAFNTASGGVYATQWTSDYIRIWFFPRSSIPEDITAGKPDPSEWGLPDANFEGSCDIDEEFSEHQIVFDTTFCGDWAGGVWSGDKVCSLKADTCRDYVASEPSAFADAYWDINYVRVFTLTDTPLPTTTKALPTTKPPFPPVYITTTTKKSETTRKPEYTQVATTTKSASSRTLPFPPFPTSPHNTTLPLPVKLEDWTYIGCLALSAAFTLSTQDANMTIPNCASSCSTYAYIGLFDTSCYCGNEISSTDTLSDAECATPCPGNPAQVCGGSLLKTGKPMSKRSAHKHEHFVPNLEKRQGPGPLLTVYQNDALANPSEVHYEPTAGELPAASTSLKPVSSIIGIGMGGGASLVNSGGVHFAPLGTVTKNIETTSITPVGQLIGIGMGGGLGISTSVKDVATTYTTVVTTTYTDLCGCAASTLQAYTITSTLTITLCDCAADHPHTHALAPQTQPEIPMVTQTRICADCNANGVVIVTVPYTEPTVAPAAPVPDIEPAWSVTAQAVFVEQSKPAATMVVLQTVTVSPLPLHPDNGKGNGSESVKGEGNQTAPIVSNKADGMGVGSNAQWRWGVCALLGLAGIVVWAL